MDKPDELLWSTKLCKCDARRHGSVKPEDTQAVEVTKVYWEVSCSLKPAMVLGRRETVILEVATELGKSKEQGERVLLASEPLECV